MSFSLGSFWLLTWFLLNIGLTLLNKSLMVFWGFHFPITMSFIHQSISVFFSLIQSIITKNPIETTEKRERTIMKRIVLISFLFTLNIVVGNISLNYCSVAFTQVCRAIIPIITMILSAIFLKQRFGYAQIAACVVICIGVALSCFGEIDLTPKGFFFTILGCFLSSSKSVSIKIILSGDYALKSDDLLARISPFSAIEMFLLACIDGENERMVSVANSKYNPTVWCIFGVIISGCMAYFLNLTNFLATSYTSPLTVTIAGCVKQITTIIISVILFNKKLTNLNIIGIVVTTIGSTWYSLLKITKKPIIEKKNDEEEVLLESGFNTKNMHNSTVI